MNIAQAYTVGTKNKELGSSMAVARRSVKSELSTELLITCRSPVLRV